MRFTGPSSEICARGSSAFSYGEDACSLPRSFRTRNEPYPGVLRGLNTAWNQAIATSEPNRHSGAKGNGMSQMRRDGEVGTEAQSAAVVMLHPQPSQRLRQIAEHILVDGFSSTVPTKIVRHLGFGSRKIASNQHSIDDDSGILYVFEVFRRKLEIVVLLFQMKPDQPTLGWRLDTNGKVVGHAFQWSIERQVATSDPNPECVALAEKIVRFLVSFYEKEGFPKVAAGKAGDSRQGSAR